MRLNKMAAAVSLSLGVLPASAGGTVDLQDVWAQSPSEFSKALVPGTGFSFRYGTAFVGPKLPDDWTPSVARNEGADTVTAEFTHPSGLVVTRVMRRFPGSAAVEYKLIFKNTGHQTLAPISGMNAMDMAFGKAVIDGNCVISSGGGMAEWVLPPRTFAIRENCLAPTVSGSGVVSLTTEGGRSSNKDLPFFLVHNKKKKEGLFVAFGWSGQWQAFAALHQPKDTLSVWARIPGIEIALEPGEQIEGPAVLVGLYQGEVADGSNSLRRVVRDFYMPKLAGQPMLPVAMYDTWWAVQTNFDETVLKRLADGAAAASQEYFKLDAGWFAGEDWLTSVGNWRGANRERLPNGLAPIAEYARSKGMKFGLWFEPERVAEGTQLAKEHPDWILWYPETTEPLPWMRSFTYMFDRPNDPLSTMGKKKFGLLDYGRPEVQEWVRNMMDGYIRQYGLKYIRYDFNFEPLPYWEAHDKPGRRGMSQLKHIQGFYAVIDWIREHHPDVVLEGCSSGGRRIDLETARRFHTMLISDQTADPAIMRFHLAGINYFLPGSYAYVSYSLPYSDQPDVQPADITFQSLFGGAFGLGADTRLWSEDTKRRARTHVDVWKKLRRYLNEDYYPLSEQPGDLVSWSGWQFHDPQDRSGFMQTFRTDTAEATHKFFVKGLKAQSQYRFTDAYGGQSFTLTGQSAMSEGIEVKQDPMTSRVYSYEEISR